jgi:hypothetical protein
MVGSPGIEESVGWGNVSVGDVEVDMLKVLVLVSYGWLSAGDTALSRRHGGRAGAQHTAPLAVSQGRSTCSFSGGVDG